MQPADDIKKLIDESKIASSGQVDRRILADALADLENRRIARTARSGGWRIVMHSKTIKLAAAAAIVIAVLLGLQFVGTSSVTFAIHRSSRSMSSIDRTDPTTASDCWTFARVTRSPTSANSATTVRPLDEHAIEPASSVPARSTVTFLMASPTGR